MKKQDKINNSIEDIKMNMEDNILSKFEDQVLIIENEEIKTIKNNSINGMNIGLYQKMWEIQTKYYL